MDGWRGGGEMHHCISSCNKLTVEPARDMGEQRGALQHFLTALASTSHNLPE